MGIVSFYEGIVRFHSYTVALFLIWRAGNEVQGPS